MPEERKYSVECKNQDCRAAITFARYITTSKRADEFALAHGFVPGKLKCEVCGQEADYSKSDVTPALTVGN